MAKSKSQYVCQNCGNSQPKWMGKCPSCGEWDVFVEENITENESKLLDLISSKENVRAVKVSEVDTKDIKRVSSGFDELDRVLGGGFVADEVALISGEPGIGKSTLLMQVCGNVVSKDMKVLYVSGEESVNQVSMRARRLLKEDQLEKINLLSNGSVDVIANTIKSGVDFVIVDSIQTIWDESVKALPGGVSQVRSAASKLIHTAKKLGVVLVIVGHINKDGKIAGPKVLEHLVDCVLQLEGHRSGEYRVLRSLKNRFGSTGEVGLLNMDSEGLVDMVGTDTFTLSAEEGVDIGVAKTVVVEGSRPIVVDIQSLASTSVYPYPKRVSEGISLSKIQVLTAIASNSKIVNVSSHDTYFRVAGGYVIKDYAFADLGVIASLFSARSKKALSQQMLFIGEVSLNGGVHTPISLERYVSEVIRIYPSHKVVLSSSFTKASKISKKNLIPLSNVSDVRRLIK